jgi:hypothetical protein
MAEQRIPLSEMIVDLRRELLHAQKLADDKQLKFRVEDIELELQFTVGKEVEAKGGVNFWVYNVEAGGHVATETVHKLRFKLKPETASGDVLTISDRDNRPTD